MKLARKVETNNVVTGSLFSLFFCLHPVFLWKYDWLCELSKRECENADRIEISALSPLRCSFGGHYAQEDDWLKMGPWCRTGKNVSTFSSQKDRQTLLEYVQMCIVLKKWTKRLPLKRVVSSVATATALQQQLLSPLATWLASRKRVSGVSAKVALLPLCPPDKRKSCFLKILLFEPVARKEELSTQDKHCTRASCENQEQLPYCSFLQRPLPPPFSRISVSIFFPPSPFPPFPPAQPRGRRFVGGIENESSFGYPFSFSPYKHWRRKKGRGDSRKQAPRPDTKTSISSSTSSVAGAGSFSSLPWLHIRFVSPRAQAKLLSHIRTEGERQEPDEVVLSDDESVFWCCCSFCWLTGPRLIF